MRDEKFVNSSNKTPLERPLPGDIHLKGAIGIRLLSKLRTQNSEILFNIILCYCSLGYIRYKRKVDNAVDM